LESFRKTRIDKLFESVFKSKVVPIKCSDYAKLVKAIKKRKDKKDFQIVTRFGKLFLKYIGNKGVFA
jgi:hypothetical protein